MWLRWSCGRLSRAAGDGVFVMVLTDDDGDEREDGRSDDDEESLQ